jgi:hypothetical protein
MNTTGFLLFDAANKLSLNGKKIPNDSSSPYYGGNGGDEFDDYNKGILVSIALSLGSHDVVYGLTLFYLGGNHKIMSYGREDSRVKKEDYLTLNLGKYVTEAEVQYLLMLLPCSSRNTMRLWRSEIIMGTCHSISPFKINTLLHL